MDYSFVLQALKANIEHPKEVEMSVKCVNAANVAVVRGDLVSALLLYGVGVLYATQWVPPTQPQPTYHRKRLSRRRPRLRR